MAKVTITNPPPCTISRRKCGWGSVITNCAKCGKVMMGHNRGICSQCMRHGARHGEPIYTAHSSIFRFATSDAMINREQSKCLRETYAKRSTDDQAAREVGEI